MKSSTVPTFCTVCLAVMSAAGSSHWWSVNQFVTAFHAGQVPSPSLNSVAPIKKNAPVVAVAQGGPTTPLSSEQRSFNDTLLKEIKTIRDENKDLRGQVAETNRDVMNLGFRVDTHSTQFRPLDVSETQSETAQGDSPSVLPAPSAIPVFPLDEE
jgi:hypothetical protein